MSQITLSNARKRNRVFLKTRWKHMDVDAPIFIEPFVPIDEIISQLEKALDVQYSFKHIVDLKQFYQKFEKNRKNERSKRKSCHGWCVEYFINEKYLRLVDPKEIEQASPVLPAGFKFVHEFSPIIQPVELATEKPSEKCANELNKNSKNPNFAIFIDRVNKDLKSYQEIGTRKV